MGRVVSFGSVNVDHVQYCETDWISSCSDRYPWFPAAGETTAVDAVPAEFAAAFDRTFLGGKGANQAVAAAAAGADSALLGAVGEDAETYAVRETLAERGVDVAGLERVAGPTGAAYVAVDETGENHIGILAGANGAVDADYARQRAETLRGADCVLFQNELPVDAVLAALDVLADGAETEAEAAAEAGTEAGDRPTVVFDPAPAGDAERVLAHECVDVVTPNDGEYERLRDALAACDGVVVRTRGADGVAVDPGSRGPWRGDAFEVEAPAVDTVDTTGAGDVFDGYLAAELAAGRDLRAAVETATVAAALSTTTEGVQTAVPSRAEVLERVR